MITIPRETADAALAAMNACHGVLTGNHRGTKVHADSIASLNAHMEIIRAALNETHDHEACFGLTCSCNSDLGFMDDVSIHDPQTPRHIFQGFCPTEGSHETLDPDCPACRTLMPKKEVAA